jgi:pimeloyl-ACP methyl ester carboxylesterase
MFAQNGVRTVRLDLHSAKDRGLAGLIEDVELALDALGGEPVVVGHSMGGLVGQVLAARRQVAGLALICPLPPGQVRLLPPLGPLRETLALARPLVAGRPLHVPWPLYRAVGMDAMDEAVARQAWERVLDWPNQLTRDLALRRPQVDPGAIRCPVLVAIGRKDRLVPWATARVLGDLYEAVTWRYDDLGHFPPWEPGGERLGANLAAWVAAPSRPQVLESEGYGPREGVGHELRRARRGEEMQKRSAYGQKRSARGG